MKRFGQFSMQALYATLDTARTARRLTWSELATQINGPFTGTPSLPISVSTLRGMATKRSVTSAVVLQVLAWLDRTPESFVVGRPVDTVKEGTLPPSGAGRILRFDTTELYAALDHQRTRQGLTWKHVAGELPGFTESMLRNLATGLGVRWWPEGHGVRSAAAARGRRVRR